MEEGQIRRFEWEGEGRGLRVFNTKRNKNRSNECENTEHEDWAEKRMAGWRASLRTKDYYAKPQQ